MSIPTEAEIRAFLHEEVECWNRDDREAMMALYRRHITRDLVIEFVGRPIGDGWATMEYIWDNFRGRVTMEVQELIVNGVEAARFVRNVRRETGLANPSLETFRFGDGTLHARYFHRDDTH